MSQQRNSSEDEVIVKFRQEENDSSTSSSLDDADRKELLWESREQAVVERWQKHCKTQSVLHGTKARVVKKRYQCLSIPAILIPVCLSGFSSVLDDLPLVNSGAMVLTSVLTGLSSFLNLGKRTADHYNAEALYADLSLSIETEMCKPKSMRQACDVYLEKIRSNISKLDLSSPNL